MYCSNCGSKLKDDSLFCSECGYKISASQEESLPVSKENQINKEYCKKYMGIVKKIHVFSILSIILLFVSGLMTLFMPLIKTDNGSYPFAIYIISFKFFELIFNDYLYEEAPVFAYLSYAFCLLIILGSFVSMIGSIIGLVKSRNGLRNLEKSTSEFCNEAPIRKHWIQKGVGAMFVGGVGLAIIIMRWVYNSFDAVSMLVIIPMTLFIAGNVFYHLGYSRLNELEEKVTGVNLKKKKTAKKN